jgi:predicted TIM-barrel fold metal-dependent hydrolase
VTRVQPVSCRIAAVRQSRREFLGASAAALAGLGVAAGQSAAQGADPIIDIHQHLGYTGRPDDVFLTHQRMLGISTTVLLPAGRSVDRPSTHMGVANGLQASALGNEACHAFREAHPTGYVAGANEVPDLDDALVEIERYLKRGGVVIGEQKFGVDCDAPAMQRLYALAREHDVPVLMHWQHGMYNFGFERFGRMLAQYPTVRFVGHAQTWWANIDARHADQSVLYPKGPVTPGGLTDRYLADYPNMFGDLSAGSGQNALTRDEDFTRGFLERHQDKLIFGSDCSDHDATGPTCIGARTIAIIRRLAGSRAVERKLLHDNAARVFKL